MISISSECYDINGSMVVGVDSIAPGSIDSIHNKVRRGGTVRTLDGGAVSVGGGVSDSDIIVNLGIIKNIEKYTEVARHLVQSYNSVVVSTEVGVFLAYPKSIEISDGTAIFTLLFMARI